MRGNPALQKLSQEDRQKFFTASPEEKLQMLKDAGVPRRRRSRP